MRYCLIVCIAVLVLCGAGAAAEDRILVVADQVTITCPTDYSCLSNTDATGQWGTSGFTQYGSQACGYEAGPTQKTGTSSIPRYCYQQKSMAGSVIAGKVTTVPVIAGRVVTVTPADPNVYAIITSLDTRPSGASVTIDGHSYDYSGKTPLKNIVLQPGFHTIVLKLAGYQDDVETIHFDAGKVSYNFAMTPEVSALKVAAVENTGDNPQAVVPANLQRGVSGPVVPVKVEPASKNEVKPSDGLYTPTPLPGFIESFTSAILGLFSGQGSKSGKPVDVTGSTVTAGDVTTSNSGPGWSTWEDLGGNLASSPSVASWGVGRLDVYYVSGQNNEVVHRSATDGRTFGSEGYVGGSVPPSAVATGQNQVYLFSVSPATAETTETIVYRKGDGSSFGIQQTIPITFMDSHSRTVNGVTTNKKTSTYQHISSPIGLAASGSGSMKIFFSGQGNARTRDGTAYQAYDRCSGQFRYQSEGDPNYFNDYACKASVFRISSDGSNFNKDDAFFFGQINPFVAGTNPPVYATNTAPAYANGQIFVKGENGHLFRISENDYSTTDLGIIPYSSPAAAPYVDGSDTSSYVVFYRGEAGQLMSLAKGDSNPWDHTGTFQGDPAVAGWAGLDESQHRIDIFVRGMDNHLWHMWYGKKLA